MAEEQKVISQPASFPDRPLELDYDPEEMTIDEAVMFEPDGFTVKGFRQFLIDHSNWTRREIGTIKVKDLKELADRVVAKFQEDAVPNEN